MHDRKAMMFTLSDAFIALPGGIGTLEEVGELLTWAQLGLHKKQCGLANVGGYYDPLLAFQDNAVSKGFMKQEHRGMLLVSEEPEEILDRVQSYIAPDLEKWVETRKRTWAIPATIHDRTHRSNTRWHSSRSQPFPTQRRSWLSRSLPSTAKQ
jgi:hypothetical protein